MAIYAGTLAIGRLLLTTIHWYSTRDDRLVGEPEEPGEVRFYLIRGLAMPVIFLLSIGVSFYSVRAAIWPWVVMILVDAVVLRRRGPR